jgi:hypothetical protein
MGYPEGTLSTWRQYGKVKHKIEVVFIFIASNLNLSHQGVFFGFS